jgi:hypothetical protein
MDKKEVKNKDDLSEGQIFEMMRGIDKTKRPNSKMEFLEKIFAESLLRDDNNPDEIEQFLNENIHDIDENEEEIKRFKSLKGTSKF